MNDMTPTREEREAKLEGLGCKRKRVEDIRFTQGKGNYIDDLKLPGMLHGDFVRSPYAHARVKSIDAEAALSPSVREALGRHLAVVDAAIAEARASAVGGGTGGEAGEMLLAAYRQKLDLLERAVRLGSES